jgi:hypothetical protein
MFEGGGKYAGGGAEVRAAVASFPGGRALSGRWNAAAGGERSAATPAPDFAANAEPEGLAAGFSAVATPMFTCTLSSIGRSSINRIVSTPQNATTRMPKKAKPSFFSLLMSNTLP